jgi:uncharacterized protein YceH (UPF0502 family)
MPVTLNDIEQRVLGVLMEKSLTQPDAYPLTFNSLLLGANQKQNRDPVREFTEREISEGLRALEIKQLVAQAPPALGARSVRFKHHVIERFHWDRREQAVMAELMLRGRQTAGELRTHAGRMTSFVDLDAVGETLNALRSHETPFVEELAREPGRSANRFRHLLGPTHSAPMPVADPATATVFAIPTSTNASEAGNLAVRVTRLEETVARLEETVGRLEAKLSGNSESS